MEGAGAGVGLDGLASGERLRVLGLVLGWVGSGEWRRLRLDV